MVGYLELIKKSWKETWINPLLFLPKLLSLIFSIILLWMFIVQFNLYNLLSIAGVSSNSIRDSLLIPLLKPSNLIWVFLYVILEISILAFFSGMGLGMYKDIVNKKKTNISKGIEYGREYFLKIIGISIIFYVLILVPLYLSFKFIAGSFFINMTIHYTISIFLVLLFIFWFFLVILKMLFVYSAMVFKKKGTLKTIEIGVNFSKIYFKHTLVVWSIVIGIGFLFNTFRDSLSYGINSIGNLIWIAVLIVLFVILDIILYVWEHIFIFNSFIEKRIKKKIPLKSTIKK